MFRNRTSSQRPGDEFIAKFRQSFPEVGVATSTASSSAANNTLGKLTAGDPRIESHHSLGGEDIKGLNTTPRKQYKPCQFKPCQLKPCQLMPSLLDPNSFAFSSFANQPPGYYTPTPGVTTTPHQNRAGDLHISGMGIGRGIGMPLSLHTSADDIHTNTMMDVCVFSHDMPQLHSYNPFGQTHSQNNQHAQHEGSPLDSDGRMGSLDVLMQNQSPMKTLQPVHIPLPASTQKVRFHVTLDAPTAMIKQADEIPITYLNKRQAYSISIVDTAPSLGQLPGTRYRTSIRISFENQQQHQRPGTCWQLWKEGRGTNEALQRGGKLQAVEYIELNQPLKSDIKRTYVDLDTASFDGFSVIWTPGVNGSTSCNIAMRFNFLSTDFSHSKGIKGTPVHLYAKTNICSWSPESVAENYEIAFCKIKLFRDHGSERKLSNDIVLVRKNINNLKQQILQAEMGMKDSNKRKRVSIISARAQPSQRPGKVQKHKRTWSTSSATLAGSSLPAQDDLYHELQVMQDMLTSTRPVSILYLCGPKGDDPDLYPVTLAREPLDLKKADSEGSAVWQQRSNRSSTTETSSLISSSHSSISQAVVVAQQGPTPWAEFQLMAPGEIQSSNPQKLAIPPDQLAKVQGGDESGTFSGWLEALGVDSSYNPPIKRPIRPVACFYILRRNPIKAEQSEYYQAIYLMQRTLKDFTNSIAAKWLLEPSKVLRTLHVLDRGLQIEMDDDAIHELNEGQDIIIEIVPMQNLDKEELEISVDVAIDSENTSGSQNVIHAEGYALHLMF